LLPVALRALQLLGQYLFCDGRALEVQDL